MGKRLIAVILDGFGIGAMADAAVTRPGDEKACTLGSILNIYPDLKLPNLEKLGLMNAYGKESGRMHFSKTANTGVMELLHTGADTFMGHQEIMGTRPKIPVVKPFQEKAEEVYRHLSDRGYQVEILEKEGFRYLLVNDYVIIGDNIDADFGMAYNCTAPLDLISFDEELEIGRTVREAVTVSRVIPFGGRKTTMNDLMNAVETREGRFVGVHAVKSKSYEAGYECRHLGYGVDSQVQVPSLLSQAGYQVSLFGKVADIVANPGGKSVSCVDTEEVLDMTIEEIRSLKEGFICTNVQETDLAGHSQDVKRYKDLLEIVDRKLEILIPLLGEEDILLLLADHGNDPSIGHNRHTRENVMLLAYKKGVTGVNLGLLHTLSDVGASVCDYFCTDVTQNGRSFIEHLK